MPKFFKVFGILYILISLTLIILTLQSMSPLWLFIAFSNIILGLALFVVGELMERVLILEEKLGTGKENPDEAEAIQQIACSSCKRKYDMDYPKCPYCGQKNDLYQ